MMKNRFALLLTFLLLLVPTFPVSAEEAVYHLEDAELHVGYNGAYDNTPQTPGIVVYFQYPGEQIRRVLKEREDYMVKVTDNIGPGTAHVKVTGINRFDGELTGSFTIERRLSMNGRVTVGNQVYNGNAHTPIPKVEYMRYAADGVTEIWDELVYERDFTCTWHNNVAICEVPEERYTFYDWENEEWYPWNDPAPSVPYVMVRGIGDYANKEGFIKTFVISRKPLGQAKITVEDQYWTGEPLEPIPVVKYEGETLSLGRDFEIVEYTDNVEISDTAPALMIQGAGNYSGERLVSFRIRPVRVSSVGLDKTEMTLTKGESKALREEIAPSNAYNREVTWSSADEGVATVDADGTVHAVASGETTVTVKTKDGGKTAVCRVKVKEKTVRVSGVSLNKVSEKILAGKSLKLKAVVKPSDATDRAVTWTSSDKSVATVSASGKVTGKKTGKATISVRTKDGAKKASCEIQVVSKIRENLKNGKYYLFTSKLGKFCMTVPDKSKKAGKSLVLIKQNRSGWQKYRAKRVVRGGEEYFALINKNSGLAVTSLKGNIVQKKYRGSDSQLFYAMRYADNSLQLIGKATKRAVGVVNGKAVHRSNVGALKVGTALRQRWIATVSDN